VKGYFYAGTSNIVLPVANKQAFPPAFQDKSRLTYYASLFNSLEVNSSFYKVPMAATVRRWAAETPAGFTFTFKLFKGITHNKSLLFEEDTITRFMRVINEAGDKKGALLVQFPASITLDSFGQFERLLGVIRDEDPDKSWDVAVEFRHASWYCGETYEVLDGFGAGMVMHDMPKSIPPYRAFPFEYYRFHGPAGDYKGGYTDAVLKKYADRINTCLQSGKTAYAYFNNTIGDALQNLLTLREAVNSLNNA
jgi:uncharacterized protein YecE (DUF72 family)